MSYFHGKERRSSLRVNPVLFYSSSFAALACMTILTIPLFQRHIFPDIYYLNNITYILDPLLLYAISCIMLTVQIALYLYYTKPAPPVFISTLLSVCIVVIIFLLATLIGDFLLKPGFNYQRQVELFQKGEPWFLSFFVSEIRTGGTSCPSGFVLRQISVLLTCLVLLNRNPGTLFTRKKEKDFFEAFGSPKKKYVTLRRRLNLSFLYFQLFFFFFVLFSRGYRGTHTLFDIGVSIGSGVYLYWVMLCAFLWIRRVDWRYLPDVHYMSFAFIPLCFFYSRSAVTWTAESLAIVLLLSLMYLVPIGSRK